MHTSAYAWATSALTAADVTGRHVLEAGAQDVNGSVRGHVEALAPASYTGTDMQDAPGVDVVCDAADLAAQPGLPAADVVICTEMLEHAEDWAAALAGMLAVLEPGGILVLTTRSRGFGYHGYPHDYWRFSVPAMTAVMTAAGMEIIDVRPDVPASPGVFCKARKPRDWAPPPGLAAAWAAVEGVTAMSQ